MSIAARCPHCAQGFSAPDKLAGKRVKCPKCAGVVAIPAGQPPDALDSLADLLDDRLPAPTLFSTVQDAGSVTLPTLPATASKAKSGKAPKSKNSRPATAEEQSTLQNWLVVSSGTIFFGGSLLKLNVPALTLIGISISIMGLTSLILACVRARKNITGRNFAYVLLALVGIGGFAGWAVESNRDDSTIDEACSELASSMDAISTAMSQVEDLNSARQQAPNLQAADSRCNAWLIKWRDEKLRKNRVKEVEDRLAGPKARLTAACQSTLAKLATKPAALQIVFQSIPHLLAVQQLSAADREAVDAIVNAEFSVPQADLPAAVVSPASPADQAGWQVDADAEPEVPDKGVVRQDAATTAKKSAREILSGLQLSTEPVDLQMRRQFQSKAKAMLAADRQADGRCLLQAAAMAGDAEQLGDALRYSSTLRQPSLCLHFGFSVVPAPPATVEIPLPAAPKLTAR